jgi:DNA-binding response OmpR family regulator
MTATILIFFPYHALRRQVRCFLDQQGFDVVERSTAREILELAAQPSASLDLVLSDLSADDGPSLAEQAIIRRPKLKVLLMTNEPEHIARTLTANPHVDFIEKPFAWRELDAKMRRLLDSASNKPPRAAAGFF